MSSILLHNGAGGLVAASSNFEQVDILFSLNDNMAPSHFE